VLDDYRDRVKIFGTHFATLDIRQDSRIHQKVMNDIFVKVSGLDVDSKSNDEKIKYLLESDVILNPDDFEDEMTCETLKSIYNIKLIQENNGERGMHRYIISNSDEVKDVMNVYVMMKLCGYSEDEINMDIVPLFETMEGLDRSEEVMRTLYSDGL
jgi:phosphoenolpyruvate carboxylase